VFREKESTFINKTKELVLTAHDESFEAAQDNGRKMKETT